MSEFFYHTLTGFSIAYFSDFSKVPSTHETNSKKLRQNFSLTKDFFLENKSRNNPFLLSLPMKAVYSLIACLCAKVLI